MTQRERDAAAPPRSTARPRIAAAVAVGLVVAFVAWLVLRDSGPDEPRRAPAIAMDLAQLRAFAGSAGRPCTGRGRRPLAFRARASPTR